MTHYTSYILWYKWSKEVRNTEAVTVRKNETTNQVKEAGLEFSVVQNIIPYFMYI